MVKTCTPKNGCKEQPISPSLVILEDLEDHLTKNESRQARAFFCEVNLSTKLFVIMTAYISQLSLNSDGQLSGYNLPTS